MIKDLEKNENDLIPKEYENESSFEILDGEEEDEDDLLKSEIEINKSSDIEIKPEIKEKINSIDIPIINNTNNENALENKINNGNAENKEDKKSDKNKKNESNNSEDTSIRLAKERIAKNKEDNEIENPFDDKTAEWDEIEDSQKKEDNEEDDDEDDEEEEESDESINIKEKYLDSSTVYDNYSRLLKEGYYLYEIKTNVYYTYIMRLSYIKKAYLLAKVQSKNEGLNDELKKDIKEILNKGNEEIIKEELAKFIKLQIKLDNIKLLIKANIKEFSIYTKIKIFYLNYLNNKISFEISININWKMIELIKYIKHLYHFPDLNNNSNITLIYKNKKYSGKEIEDYEKDEKKNLFCPNNFDYKKDYLIIIEHENLNIINIDLGPCSNKYNFKSEKIPHIIFSSHHNFKIDKILVSKQLTLFECDVYELNDNINLNIERNIGKYNFEKANQILSSFNWESKCKFISSIKSVKSSSYKNNEDIISFSLWPKFNLCQHKAYIFLVYTPIMSINIFDSGLGDQGLYVISSDNKCIINGIVGKQFSDFCLKKG